MTVRGVIRESLTGRLMRVVSSVMPATAVNSPADSVVGMAMCAGALAGDGVVRAASSAVDRRFGGVDRTAAAKADDRVGPLLARAASRAHAPSTTAHADARP